MKTFFTSKTCGTLSFFVYIRNTYGVPASIPFHTNLEYTQGSSKFLASGVFVKGGGGQLINLIYIVSPNRYVNIQSVFWRRTSRAEFGLV